MVRRSKTQGKRCLLIAHGLVYDATNFIRDHPAGVRPILKKAGEDATVDFDWHSKRAQKECWGQLLVGHVVPCARDPPAASSGCPVQ
jgi:cytochrome b involved in lipid metabolism